MITLTDNFKLTVSVF